MFKLETRNPPRGKFVGSKSLYCGKPCVRVYKQSPEDLLLQLWDNKGRYMAVALYPNEARAIAQALIDCADKFLEPLPSSKLLQIITGTDDHGN